MISQAVVDATWREVAALSPREARRSFNKLAKRQPALLAFVLAESDNNLTPRAVELANYLFFVIERMFNAGAEKLRRVPIEAVEQCAQEVEAKLESLQGAHDRFLERAALALAGEQPHVFRYLTEAVIEAPHDPHDPIPLTAEDQGGILLILATAIEALHRSALLADRKPGGER